MLCVCVCVCRVVPSGATPAVRLSLPPPTLLRPRQLWTGKQLISAVVEHFADGRPPLTFSSGSKVRAMNTDWQVVVFWGGLSGQGSNMPAQGLTPPCMYPSIHTVTADQFGVRLGPCSPPCPTLGQLYSPDSTCTVGQVVDLQKGVVSSPKPSLSTYTLCTVLYCILHTRQLASCITMVCLVGFRCVLLQVPVSYWGPDSGEGDFLFHKGHLLAGCMDKAQFGKFGLVHAMQVGTRPPASIRLGPCVCKARGVTGSSREVPACACWRPLTCSSCWSVCIMQCGMSGALPLLQWSKPTGEEASFHCCTLRLCQWGCSQKMGSLTACPERRRLNLQQACTHSTFASTPCLAAPSPTPPSALCAS